MKIWIAQVKCERGHLIIALGGDIGDTDVDVLEGALRVAMKRLTAAGKLKKYCRVCQSTELRITSERIEVEEDDASPLTEDQRRQQWASEYGKRARN